MILSFMKIIVCAYWPLQPRIDTPEHQGPKAIWVRPTIGLIMAWLKLTKSAGKLSHVNLK